MYSSVIWCEMHLNQGSFCIHGSTIYTGATQLVLIVNQSMSHSRRIPTRRIPRITPANVPASLERWHLPGSQATLDWGDLVPDPRSSHSFESLFSATVHSPSPSSLGSSQTTCAEQNSACQYPAGYTDHLHHHSADHTYNLHRLSHTDYSQNNQPSNLSGIRSGVMDWKDRMVSPWRVYCAPKRIGRGATVLLDASGRGEEEVVYKIEGIYSEARSSIGMWDSPVYDDTLPTIILFIPHGYARLSFVDRLYNGISFLFF
ncbi:hypothetical protein BC835DRAFT_1309041 [Cytidiella melzeri]|nr:hypothetical protein BC835DRAFT_1309041 [Cytidiella melzeri]